MEDDIARTMAFAYERCPAWHFLPGPFQDDPSRTNCPRRDEHSQMRRAYQAGDKTDFKKGVVRKP